MTSYLNRFKYQLQYLPALGRPGYNLAGFQHPYLEKMIKNNTYLVGIL